MKYFKSAASIAAKIFLATFMVVLGVSCSDQLLEPQAVNNGTQDIVTTQDFDGFSIGAITNKDGFLQVNTRVELGYKKRDVEKSIIGEIAAVKPGNPSRTEITQDGMIGERITRHFDFDFDGQTADVTIESLADSTAPYHYNIVDVYYVDYNSTLLDDEGELYQMLPHFEVVYEHSNDPTFSGTMNHNPRYLHVAEGVEIVDSLIIRVLNNEGFSTGSVTNVLGTGSAEVSLNLGSKEVIVDADQFGKLSLISESTPVNEDISTTTQTGFRAVKDFAFSDKQTAMAIYQYLYQLAAENHVEFTSVNYKDYDAIKTGDSTYKIKPHFEAAYRRVGTSESGVLDLIPWYTQKLKYTAPEPQNPTYEYVVDEKYSDTEANDVKMRNLNVKIYKKDKATGETVDNWRLRYTVVTSGHIVGRDTVYVSGINIVDHDFTDAEETGAAYHYDNKPIEDNEKFLETLRSHTYRCEAFAPADGGGKSVMGGQLLYQTSVITFSDGDFTWKSKEFATSVDRSDEEMFDDASRQGKSCISSDRTYKYAKSHKITAHNYLDGELWFSSTAISHLWLLQQ